MKLDTHYRAGEMIVTMHLSDEEAELPNDLLARVGCNQHRLSWSDDAAALGEKDPSTFRLAAECRRYTVRRHENGDGTTVARVTYRLPDDDT